MKLSKVHQLLGDYLQQHGDLDTYYIDRGSGQEVGICPFEGLFIPIRKKEKSGKIELYSDSVDAQTVFVIDIL